MHSFSFIVKLAIVCVFHKHPYLSVTHCAQQGCMYRGMVHRFVAIMHIWIIVIQCAWCHNYDSFIVLYDMLQLCSVACTVCHFCYGHATSNYGQTMGKFLG